MTEPKLTRLGLAARSALMQGRGEGMRKILLLLAGTSALTGGLTGCINVSAPDEPIVIELNVNIRAEVLYRLAEDANNTIEENADIF